MIFFFFTIPILHCSTRSDDGKVVPDREKNAEEQRKRSASKPAHSSRRARSSGGGGGGGAAESESEAEAEEEADEEDEVVTVVRAAKAVVARPGTTETELVASLKTALSLLERLAVENAALKELVAQFEFEDEQIIVKVTNDCLRVAYNADLGLPEDSEPPPSFFAEARERVFEVWSDAVVSLLGGDPALK